MIKATARVLHTVIEIDVGSETWVCRPVVGATGSLTQRIAALFATVYETHRAAEPNVVHSTVSYHVKKDEIIIQIGENRWKTESSIFRPTTFEYGNLAYTINERVTGRFAILQEERLIGTGELGFRSCIIRDYPTDLEGFLANLALGYLIRNLAWEMYTFAPRPPTALHRPRKRATDPPAAPVAPVERLTSATLDPRSEPAPPRGRGRAPRRA